MESNNSELHKILKLETTLFLLHYDPCARDGGNEIGRLRRQAPLRRSLDGETDSFTGDVFGRYEKTDKNSSRNQNTAVVIRVRPISIQKPRFLSCHCLPSGQSINGSEVDGDSITVPGHPVSQLVRTLRAGQVKVRRCVLTRWKTRISVPQPGKCQTNFSRHQDRDTGGTWSTESLLYLSERCHCFFICLHRCPVGNKSLEERKFMNICPHSILKLVLDESITWLL
ncbi:hypothetical protein RRG08_067395 [Elysia crispata]|uniref:Uncharacterized protein n=1 Tax=Elysia crispata TaxID=231223 RepID=A0AAE0Y916_9GAST|nr:hypothetical protein RRG08_067395 [Elysia crispata]